MSSFTNNSQDTVCRCKSPRVRLAARTTIPAREHGCYVVPYCEIPCFCQLCSQSVNRLYFTYLYAIDERKRMVFPVLVFRGSGIRPYHQLIP